MANRFYTFPGDPREYVSVTTFLDVINKPFLMPWAAKMEREMLTKLAQQGKHLDEIFEYFQPKQPYGYKLYTEVAAEFGSTIHKAIDYTLKALKLPKMTKAEQRVYDKWKEWWAGSKLYLEGAERKVRCKSLGYAGTLDALVKDELGLVKVIDWKTGKSEYPEHSLQSWAYQYALEEEEPLSVNGGLLVYIPKDKEIYTRSLPLVNRALMAPVLAALELWRWSHNKPWKDV